MLEIVAPALLVLVARPRPADSAPPPRVAPTCTQKLKRSRARFGRWRQRPTTRRGVRCHVVDPVVLAHGPSGLGYGYARVSCAFALRLLRFERVLQQEARRAFGQPVKRLLNWGSYQCRSIGGYYGMPSEHASGNALDISGVVLRSGRFVRVKGRYPRRGAGRTAAQRFWRRLAKRLYRERIFSVVLTPRYDRVHHNHLHLDGASYRVDGT